MNAAEGNLASTLMATMAAERDLPQDIPALTARLARGEEAAFREFYTLYFNRLLRYLFAVTGGREDLARDAVQLTLVRMAKHVRRFESETAFWNWLALVARNAVVDELRKPIRHQNLLTRFFQTRAPVTDVAHEETEVRLEKLLLEGLATLPPLERSLLERKYLQGESIRELAHDWKLSEKAMESHLLRLRRQLKATLLARLHHEIDF